MKLLACHIQKYQLKLIFVGPTTTRFGGGVLLNKTPLTEQRLQEELHFDAMSAQVEKSKTIVPSNFLFTWSLISYS